jgi:hypothetical protein
MFGTRISVRPPIPGLSVGGSAARGDASPAFSDEQPFRSAAAHLEYLTSRVWVRAELSTLSADAAFRFRSRASYVEVAAFLTDQVQPALLFDRVRDEVEDTEDLPGSVHEHDGWAVGLNYWVNPNFVVKASSHVARGNRLAWPRRGEFIATFMAGAMKSETRMFQVGAQYSF